MVSGTTSPGPRKDLRVAGRVPDGDSFEITLSPTSLRVNPSWMTHGPSVVLSVV